MKKYLLKLSSAMLLALALVLAGCSHDDDLEGPELVDLFGEFEILQPLTVSRTTVDFSAGETVEFRALLSIRTPWEMRIEGLTSGALKVFESNEKDISGDIANWNGSITFAPSFQMGEQAVATIRFTNYPDSLVSDTITITGARPVPTGGVLISDFEDPNQAFNVFSEAQFEESINGIASTLPAAFGSNYHYMKGTDNNGSVFVCGLGVSAQSATGEVHYPFTTSNENRVYFNAFIYGEGAQFTNMVIDFQEDDNLDGTYVPAEEGTYNYTIKVDWVGWKLVSFPLSETQLSTNGGLGNIDANGRKEVDRIINIQFILLSEGGQNAEPVGYGIDYAVFTEGQPFQP